MRQSFQRVISDVQDASLDFDGMLYPRLESGEPRLRRTAAFECSRSGIPGLVLGRFFLLFALFIDVFLIIAALRCGGS
jgi:hypothetical protein